MQKDKSSHLNGADHSWSQSRSNTTKDQQGCIHQDDLQKSNGRGTTVDVESRQNDVVRLGKERHSYVI